MVLAMSRFPVLRAPLTATILLAAASAAFAQAEPPVPPESLHTAPHTRPHRDPHTLPSHDSAAIAATIERFHAALAAGDRAGALALLDTNVVILESGGSESRKEYESHHLESDIAFARAVKSERTSGAVRVSGDVAWAWSTSTARGEFRGKPVNSAGAELMVLRRDGDAWRITAIHWSSRRRG